MEEAIGASMTGARINERMGNMDGRGHWWLNGGIDDIVI